MTMESPVYRYLPILACAFGIMTFGAMDVAMKAMAIGLSTYNALFWRCCAGFIMSAALYYGVHLFLWSGAHTYGAGHWH
jgi:hypothetical protein